VRLAVQRLVRPTTARSAPKRRRQKPSLSTTTRPRSAGLRPP
jgi:hypothetical protein